jgi:hypothetical protein
MGQWIEFNKINKTPKVRKLTEKQIRRHEASLKYNATFKRAIPGL